jgi:hypothetical protein
MPNQLDLPKLDAKIKLTINQRNLWFYFLNHKKKHKNTPCYVPKIPMQETRRQDYYLALQRLEEYGLIRVDRTSRHYTGWIMLDPA